MGTKRSHGYFKTYTYTIYFAESQFSSLLVGCANAANLDEHNFFNNIMYVVNASDESTNKFSEANINEYEEANIPRPQIVFGNDKDNPYKCSICAYEFRYKFQIVHHFLGKVSNKVSVILMQILLHKLL